MPSGSAAGSSTTGSGSGSGAGSSTIGSGSGSTAGTSSSGHPQAVQKRIPGRISLPQRGQMMPSGSAAGSSITGSGSGAGSSTTGSVSGSGIGSGTNSCTGSGSTAGASSSGQPHAVQKRIPGRISLPQRGQMMTAGSAAGSSITGSGSGSGAGSSATGSGAFRRLPHPIQNTLSSFTLLPQIGQVGPLFSA